MEHSESLNVVESNLNSMQTLVLHFPTETTPILLVFEEETPLGIHIGNDDFEKVGEYLGIFQLILFQASP